MFAEVIVALLPVNWSGPVMESAPEVPAVRTVWEMISTETSRFVAKPPTHSRRPFGAMPR